MSDPSSHRKSCAYCNKTNTTLIQCCSKDCGRWFCNEKGGLKSGSHIYLHVFYSGHKKIKVFPNLVSKSPLICCDECEKSNPFSLSVFEYATKKLLLCDECMKKKPKEFYKNLGSIFDENRLSFHVIPETNTKGGKKVFVDDVKRLEKEWRKGLKDGDINDEEYCDDPPYLPRALDKYQSMEKYTTTFQMLIQAEEDEMREGLESKTHHNVKINWFKRNQMTYAELSLSNIANFSGMLKQDDLLLIEKDGKSVSCKVKSAKEDKKILVSFFSEKSIPKDAYNNNNNTGNYTIKPLWKNTSFLRLKHGLKKLSVGSHLSKKLVCALLGNGFSQTYEENYKESHSLELQKAQLNKVQFEISLRALNASSIFLIQGPPGTGKTHTVIAIIMQMIRNFGDKKKPYKILVCAPSNKAVDVLTKRLIANKVEGLCRVFAVSKEKATLTPEFEKIALHKIIQTKDKKLKELLQRKERDERLSLGEMKQLYKLKLKIEREVITDCKVICCTCNTSADEKFEGFTFRNVFIDEAAQATEPECLLPWLHGAEKVILAGDQKQIGPIIKSTQAKIAGLNRSLFERLINNGIDYDMLTVQYRMHPEISKFPSHHFYQDRLNNHESVLDNSISLTMQFSTKKNRAFFYHMRGKEETPITGVSKMNRDEAQAIKKILYNMLDSGLEPHRIGIITPYNGQKSHLTEIIEATRSHIVKRIEISSVDGFQGGEKDYIIISCVRSNKEVGIGFLNDEKRLNVAITRAKYGQIICGNAEVLCQDENWKALLETYNENDLILEGEFGRLKPYIKRLPYQNT